MHTEKNSIRDSYEALGGRLYDTRYEQEQESKFERILQHVMIDNNEIALDVGCGTGLLLRRLKNPSVGIDISQRMLSRARTITRKRKTSHLIHADVENLPFRQKVFEKVFSVTMIQNTPDPKRSILEMARVSRANSDIVVTALKKSYSMEELKQLIRGSNLLIRIMIEDEMLKDWIAITMRLF